MPNSAVVVSISSALAVTLTVSPFAFATLQLNILRGVQVGVDDNALLHVLVKELAATVSTYWPGQQVEQVNALSIGDLILGVVGIDIGESDSRAWNGPA